MNETAASKADSLPLSLLMERPCVSQPPDRRSTPTGFYCKLCVMNKKLFAPLLSSCDATQQAVTAEIRQWLTASRRSCLQAFGANLRPVDTSPLRSVWVVRDNLDLTRVYRSLFICPLGLLLSLFALRICFSRYDSQASLPEEQFCYRQVHPQWSTKIHKRV